MKPFILANWKMHFSLTEAINVCRNIILYNLQQQLIIAAPTPYLAYLSHQFESIKFCAQDVSQYFDYGAYTGEFSAPMLKSCMIDYVIIGHSERRTMFNETNEIIAQKVYNCLQEGITPILCIGEPFTVRHEADYKTFILAQLINSLPKLTLIQNSKKPDIIIAYEPIWSIGTNMTPTNEQLMEVFTHLSSFLQQSQIANNINLVYGGSVNLNNIQQILSIPGICGVLVGKSSLDSQILSQMIKSI